MNLGGFVGFFIFKNSFSTHMKQPDSMTRARLFLSFDRFALLSLLCFGKKLFQLSSAQGVFQCPVIGILHVELVIVFILLQKPAYS